MKPTTIWENIFGSLFPGLVHSRKSRVHQSSKNHDLVNERHPGFKGTVIHIDTFETPCHKNAGFFELKLKLPFPKHQESCFYLCQVSGVSLFFRKRAANFWPKDLGFF